MNENFENQKEKLVSIKHEISLLYQQVNYLLRNERPLELLDLDVLMNRTHTLYDMLCSVNVGEMGDDEDLPFDAEDFSGLFGGMMKEEEESPESEPEPELVIDEEPELVAMEKPEPVVTEEPEPIIAPEPVEEPEQETPVAVIEEVVDEPVVQDEVKEVVEPEPEIPSTEETPVEEMPLKDEYGLFFRFEDIPEKEEEKEEEEPLIIEMPHIIEEDKPKVVHVMEEIPEEEIPERDRIHGEELVPDNPFEMPKMEGPTLVDLELENERQTSETVGDFFEQDDAEFELSTPETLGEKMMSEEVTLAEKFQQNPVRDLRSAIGINDKFLFVNELFGGSMEKYNKSIENLNDLKTLNGAMIYLNELKVELQWNSSNEAYQRLKDLVSRKFES